MEKLNTGAIIRLLGCLGNLKKKHYYPVHLINLNIGFVFLFQNYENDWSKYYCMIRIQSRHERSYNVQGNDSSTR